MKNIIESKSYDSAKIIINACRLLMEKKHEFVLSKQLLRSGTEIGALIREAEHAESKPDFLHKINIALKEANETGYWLSLLKDTGYLSETEYSSISADCSEPIKLLASIVKTTRLNLGEK